jgi:hypothetical protein
MIKAHENTTNALDTIFTKWSYDRVFLIIVLNRISSFYFRLHSCFSRHLGQVK